MSSRALSAARIGLPLLAFALGLAACRSGGEGGGYEGDFCGEWAQSVCAQAYDCAGADIQQTDGFQSIFGTSEATCPDQARSACPLPDGMCASGAVDGAAATGCLDAIDSLSCSDIVGGNLGDVQSCTQLCSRDGDSGGGGTDDGSLSLTLHGYSFPSHLEVVATLRNLGSETPVRVSPAFFAVETEDNLVYDGHSFDGTCAETSLSIARGGEKTCTIVFAADAGQDRPAPVQLTFRDGSGREVVAPWDDSCAWGLESHDGDGPSCGDGCDNDADGLADCDDPDCSTFLSGGPCTIGPEDSDATCSDGLDNDDDGHLDCDDFDCTRNPEVTVCGTRTPEDDDAACSDFLDNDLDGYLDCDDFDCSRNPNVTVCS